MFKQLCQKRYLTRQNGVIGGLSGCNSGVLGKGEPRSSQNNKKKSMFSKIFFLLT